MSNVLSIRNNKNNNLCEIGRRWQSIKLDELNDLIVKIIEDIPLELDYVELELSLNGGAVTVEIIDVQAGWPSIDSYGIDNLGVILKNINNVPAVKLIFCDHIFWEEKPGKFIGAHFEELNHRYQYDNEQESV